MELGMEIEIGNQTQINIQILLYQIFLSFTQLYPDSPGKKSDRVFLRLILSVSVALNHHKVLTLVAHRFMIVTVGCIPLLYNFLKTQLHVGVKLFFHYARHCRFWIAMYNYRTYIIHPIYNYLLVQVFFDVVVISTANHISSFKCFKTFC